MMKLKIDEELLPVQIGRACSYDSRDRTWEFEMPEHCEVTGGEFAIMPIEVYRVIEQLIDDLESDVKVMEETLKNVRREVLSDDDLDKIPREEIPYNKQKRAWFRSGLIYLNNRIKVMTKK